MNVVVMMMVVIGLRASDRRLRCRGGGQGRLCTARGLVALQLKTSKRVLPFDCQKA